MGPIVFFFLSPPKKAQTLQEAEHRDPITDGQCQAQAMPMDIYKVPLPMKPRSAPAGGSDMLGSLLLIKHIVNLASNLIELRLFFCCPGAFHAPDDRTQLFLQLSARIYCPIQERVARLGSLSLKRALTPHFHSLLTLFHFYLAVISPRLSTQFLLSLSLCPVPPLSLPLRPRLL